jgi:SAM-dependent methyltransferase
MHGRSAERWTRYQDEKRLADALRRAGPAERLELYPRVYREYYAAHPGSMAPSGPSKIRRLLSPFRHLLQPGFVVAEIGCGDGQLASAVSDYVQTVYVYDVTDIRSPNAKRDKIVFSAYGGVQLPERRDFFDLVFSTDVLEHLHPDDASAHLASVYQSLKPGGIFYCYTPNRICGPHDVSRHYSRVAQGLHLQEYSNRQLQGIVRGAGFGDVSFRVAHKGKVLGDSTSNLLYVERVVEWLPWRLRRILLSLTRMRDVLGVRLVARKPGRNTERDTQ